jgi:hypothetical protein
LGYAAIKTPASSFIEGVDCIERIRRPELKAKQIAMPIGSPLTRDASGATFFLEIEKVKKE